MGRETELAEVAVEQGYLVTRAQLESVGFSGALIQKRVAQGRWLRREHGVYQVDYRPQSWTERVQTAILAAGTESLASHRTALRLWNLDGVTAAPVEITVTFGHLPLPEGVVVHRTRRIRDGDRVKGVPVTSIPRTLLDCAAVLPPVIVAKAVDSAIRLRLVTIEELSDFVETRGGRGVKGTRRLREVVADFGETGTDSPAESEALFHLRSLGLPEPVLQHTFHTRNGPRRPDFYWPRFNKAVEIDGLDAHSSADALEADLRRQNDLLELGIELRRFSARQVRRDPDGFAGDVGRFLWS